MITKSKHPEKKAERICQQFDHISNRFYPRGDIERGYLISTGRGGIRRRIPLISIAIGIVSSHSRRFQSYVDVLTTSRDYRYLAKSNQDQVGLVTVLYLKKEKLTLKQIILKTKKYHVF